MDIIIWAASAVLAVMGFLIRKLEWVELLQEYREGLVADRSGAARVVGGWLYVAAAYNAILAYFLGEHPEHTVLIVLGLSIGSVHIMAFMLAGLSKYLKKPNERNRLPRKH